VFHTFLCPEEALQQQLLLSSCLGHAAEQGQQA
jgi:hypothetical protein